METRYVLVKAEKGTIVSSLSSSGQVSALNSIDIKAKTSGDLVYLGAKEGDSVKAGALIAQIDTTDARKSIQTAEDNLLSAQISYTKSYGTDDSNPINKQDAKDSLEKNYESGYNSVASAFIDLPDIMVSLNNILYSNIFNTYQQNIDYYAFSAYTYDERSLAYKSSADQSYHLAKASYDKNFDDYKATSRFSDSATVESIINETYETAKNVAQAIKDANNLIQFYKDALSDHNIQTNSIADTHLSSLSGNLSKINSILTNTLNAQSAIKSAKTTLANADLDIQAAKLSLKQKEDSVQDAKDALKDCYIYAPFDGVISAVNFATGEEASGAIASIITKTMVAEISFGETDIAKIKIGQKATLTFDAVSDLTITGKVSAVDVVGSSSQGVVSYNVKVVMDIQDERIKSGMSTTATIITETKTDALYVPNSALKTQQGARYVLKVSDEISEADLQNTSGVVLKNSPTRQAVETGLSDDSSTEITSGLSEGDIIVSSTVSSTAATKTTNSSSGNNQRGGGMMIPGL